MNRPIKFRAWDKRNKKMVDLKKITPLAIVPDLDIDGLFLPFYEHYILMQYTGLKDKRKKEIYESDLVKDINGVVSQIVFENTMFQGKTKDGMSAYKWRECEIIGNIFQDSHLLKK